MGCLENPVGLHEHFDTLSANGFFGSRGHFDSFSANGVSGLVWAAATH
jgi:hypothetical protein